MKEIDWVYGVSASGKETFIHRVIQEPPEQLLKRLSWQDKTIAASQLSMDLIAFHDEDPVIRQRKGIIDEVVNLTKTNDVVLIKGQFVDYEANLQRALKALLPNTLQKIINIQVKPEELVKRLIKKPWWSGDHDPEKWIADEAMLINNLLDDLGAEFPITTIDGSSDANYETI